VCGGWGCSVGGELNGSTLEDHWGGRFEGHHGGFFLLLALKIAKGRGSHKKGEWV